MHATSPSMAATLIWNDGFSILNYYGPATVSCKEELNLVRIGWCPLAERSLKVYDNREGSKTEPALDARKRLGRPPLQRRWNPSSKNRRRMSRAVVLAAATLAT